jgi:hypothetical protein
MNLNRQHGLDAVNVGVANRGRDSAETSPRTYCPQPRTSRQEDLTLPTEWSRPAGYLLAGTVPLVFCSGLVGLAVSSSFEVAVPRWLILAYGLGCALLAVLALLLSRPAQQLRPSVEQDHCDWKEVNVDRWAATWSGPLERLPTHRPPRSSVITCKRSVGETNHEERQPPSEGLDGPEAP